MNYSYFTMNISSNDGDNFTINLIFLNQVKAKITSNFFLTKSFYRKDLTDDKQHVLQDGF